MTKTVDFRGKYHFVCIDIIFWPLTLPASVRTIFKVQFKCWWFCCRHVITHRSYLQNFGQIFELHNKWIAFQPFYNAIVTLYYCKIIGIQLKIKILKNFKSNTINIINTKWEQNTYYRNTTLAAVQFKHF